MGQPQGSSTVPFAAQLKWWLVFVASLRLLSVYIGFFDIDKFKIAVFGNAPQHVNPLVGRLFAAWTLVTCSLCIICARNISNRPLFGATLLSFLVAIGFFALEFFIYKTVSAKGLASPLIVASLSSLWMAFGWFKGQSEPAEHYNVTALRRWLMGVAFVRLYSVYLGYFDLPELSRMFVDLKPDSVNPLYGHLFAAWTLITSIVCLLCSRNPTDPAIYGATVVSFAILLFNFTTEYLIFQTVSLRAVFSSLLVSGLSVVWMGAGWNYYTKYCKDTYNGEQASKGVSSHPLEVDGKEEDGPCESSAVVKKEN